MILQGRNLTQGLTGADVAALHGELTQLGYAIPPAELAATQFGPGTLAAVQQLQTARGVASTGVVDSATADAITEMIRLSTFVVSGHVKSAVSTGLSGLSVRLVDKNVGADVVVASVTTDESGAYTITTVIGPPTLRSRLKVAPDLQTQVIATSVDRTVSLVAVSPVEIGAKSPLTLDIALPDNAPGLPSEHETLAATLARMYSGRLQDLKENEVTQDVTYLSARSGWDARAIAMASLADQFSTLTAPAPPSGPPTTNLQAPRPASLRPEFYYALFRGGAAADADSLFQMHPATVSAIWTQAVAQGVIPKALTASIPQALQAFQALSAAHILVMPPKIGVSTIKDLVAPTLTGAGQAEQFAALLVAHSGNWAGFWSAAEIFGAAPKQKLQFVGQLSYLTLDNAPLLKALDEAEAHSPLTLPIDLATRGYWEPGKWTALIGQSIPPGVPGASPQERAANYSAFLAAQVKLSFPTAVLAQQVKSGAIPLANSPAAASDAADFLTAHQADFAFGVEPVETYVARNNLTPSKTARFHLKRLQRVYQMTTSDQAMSALLTANVDSAFAIVRYDSAGFVRAFADKVGGADAARAIHARAKQIHGVTLNVAMRYAKERVSPRLGGSAGMIWPSPAGGGGNGGGQSVVAATLDSLFGSLDTCGCDDCESILSPAAYLVDLLNYLDQAAPIGANPQAILFGRRPDLQYLPLTCENTEVPLPYIDLVNETLEYFVANGLKIDGFQGFDTGDQVTSAELIAAPQNVKNAAYTALQGAFFPAPLPFNRPLALLRAHMGALGVSTPDAMELLRRDDSLNGQTPGSADYGWNDILIERLGISRDELRIFTDPALQLGDLVGLAPASPPPPPPAPDPALATLNKLNNMNIHDLARRAGITYDNLVAILKTQFVNPAAALIPKLERLGAPFSAIKALRDNPASVGPMFMAALPAGLDYSQYGGPTSKTAQDVVNWLVSDAVYLDAINLITISNPTPGAIDCTGTQLQLRYANPVPDNTLSSTDWLKMIRFIRLWRKLQALLGGDDATTIQQTDAILAALYPAGKLPATPWDSTQDAKNRPLLDAGFLAAIQRAGFVFQAIELLGLDPNAALPSMLACVAPIGSTGTPSFYQSLFASPTLTAIEPGAQFATLPGPLFANDILQTTINGASVPYQVAVGEIPATAAAGIASAINASPTIRKRFFAQALGSSIIVTAGFAVVVPPAPPGATETLTPVTTHPTLQKLTVAGAPTPGNALQFVIDGLPIVYTVAEGDTLASIADGLRDAVNATTAADPYCDRALNTIVAASSSNGVVTLISAGVGAPFALTCSVQPAFAAFVTSYLIGQAASPFADNGFGVIFADWTQKLLVHEPFLCAACNLTGPEFAQIAEALGFDFSTPLDLDKVSAVYRNGWFAHALGLSVLEFLRLKQCSGLDPFAPLDLGAPPNVAPPLILFIKMAQAMTAAGLDPVQALYLIWNEDITGALAPKPTNVTALALTLRKDFAAVEATFARKDDPNGSIGQALMALVYGASDTAFFFSLLSGSYRASVPFANASSVLPQTAITASAYRLSYDDQNKLLTATGYLDPDRQKKIKDSLALKTHDKADKEGPGAGLALTPDDMTNIVENAVLLINSGANAELVPVSKTNATSFTADLALKHDGTAVPFVILNDPSLPAAIDALALTNQQAVAPFFAQYPELWPLYIAFVGSTEPTAQRYTNLLGNFLPILKGERKRQQALTDISAAIGQNSSFASALLQNANVLHASGDTASPAVFDLTNVETGGLSAQFFLDGNPSGANPQAADVSGPIQFAQIAILSGPPSALVAGATVTTTIDSIDVAYALTSADVDFPTLAGNIAKAINGSIAIDLGNGKQIGSVVSASAAGPAVVLTSRSPADPTRAFTMTCHSSSAGLVYASTQGPLSDAIASQLPSSVAGVLPEGNGGAPIAVALNGYIVAPQDGAYSFSVVIDAGAQATLSLGGLATPLSFGASAQRNAPVNLSAGILTPTTLLARGVKTTLTLSWQSTSGVGWQPIPAPNLFTQSQVDRLRNTYTRFLNAASLASALSLNANEIAYLAYDGVATSATDNILAGSATVHPTSMAKIGVGSRLAIDAGPAKEVVEVTAVTATSFTATMAKKHDGSTSAFAIVSPPSPDVGRGWLNTLPGSPYGNPLGAAYAGGADGARLRATLQAVLDFARLKKALSPSDERFLQTLRAPGAPFPNGQTALANLTGWQPASLNALLMRFTGSTSLGALCDVETFARVYDGLAIVSTCRVSAGVLLGALTNAPTASGIAALQSALRARYAAVDWLAVVKPINDALRVAQRDALVAYILQGFKATPPAPPYDGVDTADKLFEFFLMDVENQPAVLTSRILLALSSAQLFIERVLRGLETQTSPGDIDPQRWEWMKRYRVWQANREVFLTPENWLYPELRDDQSPMFKKTLSALLQGDMTDDAAAEAYLGYLADLEQIAKLEPCGLWYVPAPDGTPGGELAYVVARTAGMHRKHYFRRLQGGSWTPWEEVKIDCEDMPLTPIVWNGRLFLFWLKILKGQPPQPAIGTTSNDGPVSGWKSGDVADYVNSAARAAGVSINGVLCWSEFHNGAWQPMKTSDINRPVSFDVYKAGDRSQQFEGDRNRFRILPAFYSSQNLSAQVLQGSFDVPKDALILMVNPPDSTGFLPLGQGFLLHNTHSLPVLTDDIKTSVQGYSAPVALGYILDIPASQRVLAPADTYLGANESDTFSIDYYQSAKSAWNGKRDLHLDVLSFTRQPRFVEPQIGPGDVADSPVFYGDVTEWPFFYEDRRCQFYVTC